MFLERTPWLLTTITPLGQLGRMTQFKEKKDQVEVLNAGLQNYPILQAADILLYKPEFVPVGEDQLQHIELTRNIAKKFNSLFGDTFPEPKAYVPETSRRVMALNDPTKKMSKSLEGSFVALTDADKEITKKIKRAVTDVGPLEKGKMSLGVENLFNLVGAFSKKATYDALMSDYKNEKLKYSDLKGQLIEDTIAALTPIREKLLDLEANPKKLDAIVEDGAERARKVARPTIEEVRTKMGLFSG